MSLLNTARFALTIFALLGIISVATAGGRGFSAKCEIGTTVLSPLAGAVIEKRYPFFSVKEITARIWEPLWSGLSERTGQNLSELGCNPDRNRVEPNSNICTISVKCFHSNGFQRNLPARYAVVIETKGNVAQPIGMVVYQGGDGCGLIYSGRRLLAIESVSCR